VADGAATALCPRLATLRNSLRPTVTDEELGSGGDFAAVEKMELACLLHFRLKAGDFLIDVGCGGAASQQHWRAFPMFTITEPTLSRSSLKTRAIFPHHASASKLTVSFIQHGGP
jgi:hypothetical protein